jgi:hypothetical protein
MDDVAVVEQQNRLSRFFLKKTSQIMVLSLYTNDRSISRLPLVWDGWIMPLAR